MNVNVGDRKLQKCGLEATVLKVISDSRCEVSLSNGVIKEVSIEYFKRGNVSSKEYNRVKKAEIGFSQKQFRSGMNAKIISLSEDGILCSVKFDNGVIRKDVSVSSFFNGVLGERDPNVHIDYQVGDRVLQKCGEYAEIIEKKEDNKIVVKLDCGCTKEVTERYFRMGNVKPDFNNHVKVGDTVLQSCGHYCTVISMNGGKVDVMFDNGIKRFGVNKYTFAKGVLPINIKDVIKVGEKIKQSCGEDAEVLELLPDWKCLVRFDSGYEDVVSRKTFRRGLLNYKKEDLQDKYLGMRVIAKNGIELRLIKYISYNNIIVESSDGKTSNTKLPIFLSGSCNLTNKPIKIKDSDILGMKVKQKCGLVAECIELKDGGNYIIVKYENGYCKSVHRKSFLNGSLTLIKSELMLYKTYSNPLGMKYTVFPSSEKNRFNVRFEDNSELVVDMRAVYVNNVYPDKLYRNNGKYVKLKSNNNIIVLNSYFDYKLKKYICVTLNKLTQYRNIIIL